MVDGRTITVTLLLGAGLLVAALGQFLPWADVEALETDYRAWNAEAPNGTTSWYDADLDGADGVGLLQTAPVFMVVAMVGAAMGLVFYLADRRLAGAILGAVAGFAMLAGTLLAYLGIDAFYQDTIGLPKLLGWSFGLYLGIASTVILLLGSILGFAWAFSRVPGAEAGEAEDILEGPLGVVEEATPLGPPEHSGEWPDPDQPLIRKLRCPQCTTVFPSPRGESPVCPECGYGAS